MKGFLWETDRTICVKEYDVRNSRPSEAKLEVGKPSEGLVERDGGVRGGCAKHSCRRIG